MVDSIRNNSEVPLRWPRSSSKECSSEDWRKVVPSEDVNGVIANANPNRDSKSVYTKFKRKLSKTPRYKWMKKSPITRSVKKQKRINLGSTPILDRLFKSNSEPDLRMVTVLKIDQLVVLSKEMKLTLPPGTKKEVLQKVIINRLDSMNNDCGTENIETPEEHPIP